MTDGATIKAVDYLDGFQYAGSVLQFFPHPEGYVKATAATPTNTSYYYDYVYNYTDHLGNVRLSYSKDPLTNQLKIMDETHYYPFGMEHKVYVNPGALDFKTNTDTGNGTKITNVLKTDYLYKYNGKELQDELGLNLYDYGARNYDPALGRFFNLDRYSDAYYHITPYQYTANNPVRLIDINGEYIWIYEDGNKYKYENGQLYSQNKETKEYDQAYTAEEGSYVAQMQGFLNQIGCDDCSAGKELLGFFENDERNITIRENKEKRPRYKEKNAFNGAGNTVLTFFNQKNHIPTVDGFELISKNFFTTLGHELGHAQSHFLYGAVTDEPWYIQYDSDGNPQKVKKDEVYATFIENKIRSENGLPLRTHYSAESEFKVNESSRVLHKVKGNWIMTPDARVILNAIQSPSNRK